jgi:hypothetical protein
MKKIKLRKFLVDTDGKSIELFLFGEIHLYNFAEKEGVIKFAENTGIDYVLYEGGSKSGLLLDYGIRLLYLINIFLCFFLGRKYKAPLLKWARERRIAHGQLEEGLSYPVYFEMATAIGSLGAVVLFLSFISIFLVPELNYFAVILEGFGLFLLIIFALALMRMHIPREEYMVRNLSAKLSEVSHKKIVVLVGIDHFDRMSGRIEKLFNTKGVDITI